MKKARSLKEFCEADAIGIDVCKASLDIVGIQGEKVYRAQIKNNRPSIMRLAQGLVEGQYCGKIVCESTGHYHLLLGLIFTQSNLDIRIINPLLSSKHAQSRIRKTKTDVVDGYVLATMCLTERELPAQARLTASQVAIRLKQGRLRSIEKQLQSLTRSANHYRDTHEQLGLAPSDSDHVMMEAINTLKTAKQLLHKELEALLADAMTDDQTLTKLQAIPGFSRMVAGLVGLLDREVKSARAWIAYVGLDVSIRESGTWKGRGKLTKRGNPYLRKRLYSAAWGATRHYEPVSRYYEALKAKKRNHVEALNIIAKKLLRIAYAILVEGREFNMEIAFGSNSY